MNILAIGLNHKTAPIDIRERLAFDTAETIKALRQLKSDFPMSEFVLISTCNRVEFYIADSRSCREVTESIIEFLSGFRNVATEDFKDFLYIYEDRHAIRHLLTVASSLDSMVVGEAQIIAQVKESYKLACSAKSVGKVLNRLFHRSFATCKKILTNTSIATGRVSIAGVAVELAMQLFADISSAKVVVIGAGEMGELLVQHLLHINCKDITIVNRSLERGRGLAQRYGIMVQKWDELDEQLITADIIIASAAGQDYLFKKAEFKKTINRRRKGTLLIIDIAVPRNFEPGINSLEDVYLYSIDDLSDVVEQNRKAREKDISEGMQIVEASVGDFMDWFRARDIGPLVGQMRQRFAQIGQKELDSFFAGLRQEAPCRESAESMVKRIVNRLLHCVIKNVNVVAKEQGPAEAAKLVDSIVRHAEELTSVTDGEEEQSP